MRSPEERHCLRLPLEQRQTGAPSPPFLAFSRLPPPQQARYTVAPQLQSRPPTHPLTAPPAALLLFIPPQAFEGECCSAPAASVACSALRLPADWSAGSAPRLSVASLDQLLSLDPLDVNLRWFYGALPTYPPTSPRPTLSIEAHDASTTLPSHPRPLG